MYTATGGASSSSQPDLPNIRVTAKRPFANGTLNQFTTQIGAGGSGYGSGHAPQVNERALSVTNGWSIVGAGSQVEDYNIEGIAIGDVDISSAVIIDQIGWGYLSSTLGDTITISVNGFTAATASTTSTQTMFFGATGQVAYPPGGGSDLEYRCGPTVTTVNLYEGGVIIAYVQITLPWLTPFADARVIDPVRVVGY